MSDGGRCKKHEVLERDATAEDGRTSHAFIRTDLSSVEEVGRALATTKARTCVGCLSAHVPDELAEPHVCDKCRKGDEAAQKIGMGVFYFTVRCSECKHFVVPFFLRRGMPADSRPLPVCPSCAAEKEIHDLSPLYLNAIPAEVANPEGKFAMRVAFGAAGEDAHPLRKVDQALGRLVDVVSYTDSVEQRYTFWPIGQCLACVQEAARDAPAVVCEEDEAGDV